MANSITLAQSYQAALDATYREVALTGRFETPSRDINFTGAATAKVRKMSAVGLGNYSRSTGFPVGDLTVAWETITLSYERGRAMTLDNMDAEEAKTEAAEVAGEYLRNYVVPEVDAYRFSKWASATDIQEVGTPASLDKTSILGAIDAAKAALDTYEVPAEGRVLFISTDCANLLDQAITRVYGSGGAVDRRIPSLDGIEIIRVPQARFYKGITLNAGGTSSAGGFSKTTSTGRDINFLLVHPTALGAVTKHAPLRLFNPEQNQTADAWLLQYRVYGEAWVMEQKVKGVYSHIKAS